MLARLSVALLITSAVGLAQDSDVKTYVRAHDAEIFREFSGLVAIPNVHGDVPNLKKNAEYLRGMLARRGMKVEIWDVPDGAPEVYGEKLVPGAKRTILFYIHFDGQPVEKAKWASDPFNPTLRDGTIEEGAKILANASTIAEFPPSWRLYGRGAGDDKGPIEAFVSALDAIGGKTGNNIKVILDSEEEGGGTSLASALKNHHDQLKNDVLVFLDGPQHTSGLPTVYYGARGGTNLTVTVYTAKSGLHSGNYGNWMPDANVRLSQLISSMVDTNGKVLIDGFYSDVLPLPADAMKMINAVPDNSPAMQKIYGVGSLDGAAHSLQEGLNLPTFSVHMMKGGEVGGVIPGNATAEIAMRLVVENSASKMQDRVIAHIRKQGYFITDKDPDLEMLATHPRIAKVTLGRRGPSGDSGAWRTDPNSPQAKFVSGALRSVYGDRFIELRTIGGTVPATGFIESLKVPVIGVALANYDDNQHTDNENLRLGNLWDGIETLAAIMRGK